jgi:hypothetical protein
VCAACSGQAAAQLAAEHWRSLPDSVDPAGKLVELVAVGDACIVGCSHTARGVSQVPLACGAGHGSLRAILMLPSMHGKPVNVGGKGPHHQSVSQHNLKPWHLIWRLWDPVAVRLP